MIRKMLLIAGAITMIALIAIGLTFGLPAESTTSAAASPVAAAGCDFPINITKITLGPRKPGGGHDVDVFWQAPSLPDCVSIAEYKVYVKNKLPKREPEKEIVVAANRTSATVPVPGLPLDRDVLSVSDTVTAVLKTAATSKGSKTQPISSAP